MSHPAENSNIGRAEPRRNPELCVIMPAYNEEASIRKVLNEWLPEIENFTSDFCFLVFDDGSSDSTAKMVENLAQRHGPRLECIRQENRGHGQTCLRGYHEAISRGAEWVFQLDSDGQCDPQYFFRFWRLRHHFDAIYGFRKRRDDGWKRMLASSILRWMFILCFRTKMLDPNVPYRLYRTQILEPSLSRIPDNFDLANIGLSYLLARRSEVRHQYVPIRFGERYGGEPSVKLGSFSQKARELYQQLRAL